METVLKFERCILVKELTERFNKQFNLNLSESSISNKKNKLGLSSGITGGQFQKGHNTWNKGIKGAKPSFNPCHIPLKNPEIGFQYLNITKATAEIAKAIQPRGFVSNVTVKARKAIIAVRIIFGIARKPFLNAFKPFIKSAGKLFIEVIAHSFKAIDDFKILKRF